MSTITLLNASCADQQADAIVNAANPFLLAGGGICGVIFDKAGKRELTDACKEYKTPLKTGEAVITPAFNLTNAKNIIHAVGPDFRIAPWNKDGLCDAYYNSLLVLKENNLRSISFPLISSGIYGGMIPHPAGESAKQCLKAYDRFVEENPEYEAEVLLCAFTEKEMAEAKKEFDLRPN